MSRSKTNTRTRKTPADTFRSAIVSTQVLEYRKGLQAVREGKDRIAATDPQKILGSVAIDDDCRDAYPDENRWDYVIGYDADNQPIAHYVEVHPAITSEVTTMEKKLAWLKAFLRDDARAELSMIEPKFHWVASGGFHIPHGTPQYRKLQRNGLAPVKFLKLT